MDLEGGVRSEGGRFNWAQTSIQLGLLIINVTAQQTTKSSQANWAVSLLIRRSSHFFNFFKAFLPIYAAVVIFFPTEESRYQVRSVLLQRAHIKFHFAYQSGATADG